MKVMNTRSWMGSILVSATLGLLVSACDSGPKSGEEITYYSAKVDTLEGDAKSEAVSKLLATKNAAAVPLLFKLVQGSDALPMRKEVVAFARTFKNRGWEGSLLSLLDLKRYPSTDPKLKSIQMANVEIANAFADFGDVNSETLAALIKMADVNHNESQLAAVTALGVLKKKEALPILIELAENHANNFIVKNAIIALGEIADAKAIPALIEKMFFERKGASFYPESSYALFQIGKPAVEPLIQLFKGEWSAIEELHVDRGVQVAKALQVLSDIGGDPRIKKACLDGVASKGELTGNAIAATFSRKCVGWMGYQEATAALKKSWDDTDQSKAEHALEAIARIGKTELAGELMKMSTQEGFVSQCMKVEGSSKKAVCEKYGPTVRAPRLKWLSMIAPGSMKTKFETMEKSNTASKLKSVLKEGVEALSAASRCEKGEESCWAKELENKSAAARRRAALELVWKKSEGAQKLLVNAVGDKDNEVRSFAMMGLSRTLPKFALKPVRKICERDMGKTEYVRTNQDLKRLVVKLERGY